MSSVRAYMLIVGIPGCFGDAIHTRLAPPSWVYRRPASNAANNSALPRLYDGRIHVPLSLVQDHFK